MKEVKNLKDVKNGEQIDIETSINEMSRDQFTKYLQNAYDWYNSIRSKMLTEKEIGYIIDIEEHHKLQIIKNYQKFLEDEK